MEMFRFAHIGILWGLLIIPLLALFFIWARFARKRALTSVWKSANHKRTDAVCFQKQAGI
jgi:hypothetical protein